MRLDFRGAGRRVPQIVVTMLERVLSSVVTTDGIAL
jgi:hypothetical protein